MSEFSFEVRQDALDLVRSADIQANFDECKAALNEMMGPYKSLVIMEADLPQAKADRARIRRVAARIDEARKEVKRVYSEPLKQFEDKCKELTAICAEADSNIDTQVKAFEQAWGAPVKYKIAPRRSGDIGECYADPQKAKNVLGWSAERDLKKMCEDSARWQRMNPDGYPNE